MDLASSDPRPLPSPTNTLSLDSLFFSDAKAPSPNAYVKKTILQSPIVTRIVPQFVVCLTKPLSGLSSSFVGEEKDQTWVPPEQDSFFADDMSEDDAILGLANHTSMDLSQDSLEVKVAEEKFAEIELLVKHTSLLVDGVEYPLTAAVTASVVVPKSASSGTSEDSLLIALSSGFQLLIRIWKVPRSYSSALFGYDHSSPQESSTSSTSHVYKPFVVQWWRLSGEDPLESTCSALSVHPKGLFVVSGAPDSVFRIHSCENTTMGMQLSSHFNVPVNGVILHSCFAHPFNSLAADNHILFMILTFTNQRRLSISLYSWYASEPLSGNIEKTSLPLNGSFPFPVMVVPLAENSSFLFVCPDEFIIVTVNNIWSADYSFSRFAYDGSFPTSYYLSPSQSSSADEEDSADPSSPAEAATDEVFLASETGVVYSVIVTGNKELKCNPVLRIADAISTFTFNHCSEDDGFILTYASDSAGIKALYFPSLMSPQTISTISRPEKLPYTEATLLKDYRNWAPIVDVSVIDAAQPRTCVAGSSQELWALTGMGKRSKLCHLRSGYVVKRESRNFENLRKSEALYTLTNDHKQFLVCSMPFETKLLDYVPEIEEDDLNEDPHNEDSDADAADPEPITEIDEPALVSNYPTLCCQFLPHSNVAFQFTRHTITATNMEVSKTSYLSHKEILFAEMVKDIAVLAVQMNGAVTIEIIKLGHVQDFSSESDLLMDESQFQVLSSIPSNEQLSMMRCIDTSENLLIVCGNFLGDLGMVTYAANTGDYASVFEINLRDFSPASSTDECVIIPHDCVFSEGKKKLYVGSKAGHFLEFDMDEMFSPNPSQTVPKLSQMLELGTSPVKLVLSKNDPNFVFACMRNLWLFNFYSSPKPMRVSFEEKTDKNIFSMVELPTQEPQHLRFAFLREDGLVIGSVFCHERPILRQMGIGEAAKRLLFLDTCNLFVILCKSKSQSTRIKFAERKSFKMLPTVEIDSRSGSNRNGWIFAPSEIPTCAMIWHINRNERVSKKLMVGTSIDGTSGNLKILDITKVMLEGTRIPTVKVVELRSISRDKPVTSIQQLGSTIFFSAGTGVYSTSYSIENKKFSPVAKLATFSSDVTNLGTAGDDKLLVNTRLDSILVFKYTDEGDGLNPSETCDELSTSLSVSFKDPVPRCLVNASAIGDKYAAGDKLLSSLRVFNPEAPSPHHFFSYRLSMVPRVYTTNFSAYWSKQGNVDGQICCVAVNGQVLTVSPVYDQGGEVTELKHDLALEHKLSGGDSLDTVMERLDRPFVEKVTGKGFHSVYKPFFDFGENKEKVIDYDVEEISKMSRSGTLL
ncbi:hypothetical protein JCM33374_g2660 [Metschnikowia sp. JCM 33374]|nr:hypothetical protein JCM33374_g2660 [Metschnikowia sp. JCM 33374]